MGNTPNIRFKGFTDDWEQRKFSELYEKSSEKNDGSIDVERNITVATMQFKPDVTVSSEDYLKTYYTFNVGDIAFEGHHSKDFMFGRFVENDIGDGIVSHIFAVFRPIVDYDLYYWKYAIHNESIMRPILSKSTKASTMMHDLVTKDFLNESILVPSVDEQKRIGAYLNNLDSLITLHQRKCDETKELKKFMLQKMFPKNGEKKPEIRFEGFTDDWEQRKFGDIGTVSMCKRIFKNETSDKGEIPFYKIGTFGGEPDAYISRELFEEYKGKFSYPNKGDILLSASGTIGRIVEYDGEEAYFQDSNIVWLLHDESVCNKFLKVLYPVIRWDGIEGSTIQRLYNDNFLKTRFMMPSVEEQEKIGEYFSRLDNLITLHQRKCDEIKEIKKFMLQNMFPQKG